MARYLARAGGRSATVLNHVGLIPDGLRRWADANGASLHESYLRGANKVVDIIGALHRHGVRTVSVYNLSRANLARRDDELEAVYAASTRLLSTLLPRAFDPAVCSVKVHGALDLLPPCYVEAAREVESVMTGSTLQINVLAAYDACDELRAAHERARRENIDIGSAFDIGEVDMVIRSTADPLLSGFLPLQTQYAQLHFLSTPLNDLTDRHIDELVAQYHAFPQRRGR